MQNYESNPIEEFPPSPVEKDASTPDLTPISPDNPPWNSLTAFLVWVASVAFIIIVPSFFVLPYILSRGVDFKDQSQMADLAKKDPTTLLLNVLGVIPAHILTLILAWLIVTKFRKFSFRETLGWRWNGFNFWNCLIILGGFYILAAVAGHFYPEQENDLLRILKSSRTAVYVVAFMATFTAPLVEEVVYRGILYSAFQRTIGVPLSVLLVTFLFALVHVPQYYPSYSTIFLICLLSLVLTLVRVRTGNLLPCVALHTVFNGTQSLLLILQPFIEDYIKTHQPQGASIIELFK
ncbi:MAG TPA: type II CAAX endopeptidase family protein [Pyrinomonadaceae bacterium]|nr:type II CAAX endopeptidase family protein [Pyrinomonadaceae bacterium]